MSSDRKSTQNATNIVIGVLLVAMSIVLYASVQDVEPLSMLLVLVFAIIPLLLFGIYNIVAGLVPLLARQKPTPMKNVKKHVRVCMESICYEIKTTDTIAYLAIGLRYNRKMLIALQDTKEGVKRAIDEIRKALDEIEKNL